MQNSEPNALPTELFQPGTLVSRYHSLGSMAKHSAKTFSSTTLGFGQVFFLTLLVVPAIFISSLPYLNQNLIKLRQLSIFSVDCSTRPGVSHFQPILMMVMMIMTLTGAILNMLQSTQCVENSLQPAPSRRLRRNRVQITRSTSGT